MRQISFLILFLICSPIVHAQNTPKLTLKITSQQTNVSPYTNILMKAWLYNNGTKPISLFRQDYTAPAWYGVIENWYCTHKQKKDTLPKLMEEPTSGFNENNIIDLIPGDSMIVDTIEYTIYEPGSYTFLYNIISSRRKVITYYAMTAPAKKKALSITEFDISSQPLTILCKPVVFSTEKIMDLPLDEVIKSKKQINGLCEAFKNPEEVFRFRLEGELKQRDLKAISQLKNIHSLTLSNIIVIDNDKENTPVFDLPNLKELIIEDSQIEITDNFIIKFPKLEKISFKNVIYHDPSKALNNLTQIESIVMTNCQINTLTSDFSKLQKLVRLELNQNNLKEVPAITNLLKLEYIDIQENKLTAFPNVFNNPSLKIVYLAKNKITNIPVEIGKLKTLISMDLSGNNITELPDNFGKLGRLSQLDISENRISELPESLLRLKKLTLLKVKGNPVNENKTSRALRKKLKSGYYD